MFALNHRFLILFMICMIYLLFSVMLVYKEDGILSAVAQSTFLLFWSYVGHVAAHYISLVYPINKMNTHISIHHSETELPRILDLGSESVNNFFGFFCLYLFQELSGYKFLNLKLILYSAFLYIGVHIFYYSLTNTNYHKIHHEHEFYNYSPEIFDFIFNTRKNDEQYENIFVFYEAFPALISYYIVKQIFENNKGIVELKK